MSLKIQAPNNTPFISSTRYSYRYIQIFLPTRKQKVLISITKNVRGFNLARLLQIKKNQMWDFGKRGKPEYRAKTLSQQIIYKPTIYQANCHPTSFREPLHWLLGCDPIPKARREVLRMLSTRKRTALLFYRRCILEASQLSDWSCQKLRFVICLKINKFLINRGRTISRNCRLKRCKPWEWHF